MNTDKQAVEEIDELTTVLYEANHKKSVLDYRWLATEAYNKGYRKQSEGEWIEMDTIDDGWTRYGCNNCDWNTESYYKEKYDLPRYCPNCGAKMKGGAEG